MQDFSEEILRKFEKGPLVLFIGQRYLSLTTGKDILLESILTKYNKSSLEDSKTNDYNSVLNLDLTNKYDLFSSWTEELCKNISAPEWLDKASNFHWSHIYTSSIDPIVARPFSNEWRSLQMVYDDKLKIVDIRNRFKLHVTYLFGCVTQIEQSKKIPTSRLELTKRKLITSLFLQKLPEIITSKGLLIIEGYNEEKDWMKIEDLYSILSNLPANQTIIFSCSDDFLGNELIEDLISTKKLIAFKESFTEVVLELEISKQLNLAIPEQIDYYGKWLTIGEKKVKIPSDLFNKVANTATIVFDGLFNLSENIDEEDKYLQFKAFLAGSSVAPMWQGYPLGFSFKRSFYDKVKRDVIERLSGNQQKDVPLILFGQSSSGKTTSLGLLAYDLSQIEKIPVLFIEKRYQKIDEIDIDNFCKWAEDNNAKNTVIIWDGMVDPDQYYNLLRRLNTRGRNIILVGSTYSSIKIPSSGSNFHEVPIELDADERKRFLSFLQQVDPILSNVISSGNDKNLLSMLFRYLPASRLSIKAGLKSEFDFFTRLLTENDSSVNTEMGSLADALVSAGLLLKDDLMNFEKKIIIDTDRVSIADQLIFLIMVPGQYALGVPYELLLRTIGFDTMSSKLFKSLNEIEIITWFEDSQGNIMLSPRTAIEAKILANYIGSIEGQVDYIKQLLSEINSFDFGTFGFETSPEVQFAVELLNNIGPNTTEKYIPYLYDITEILRHLRENVKAYHPRLILKEASFLRELVIKKIETPESYFSLLDRAELIVLDALEKLKSFQERTITTFLRVELASILGTKIQEFGKEEGLHEKAVETYELIKQINSQSFVTNPDNYNALDVLAWTTDYLIKNKLLSSVEQINAEVEMTNLFEMVDVEGVSENNRERFLGRKLQFYELVGKIDIADNLFLELNSRGAATGYYLRALKFRGFDNNEILQDADINRYKLVFEYLDASFDLIKNDGRCLFLLFKSWWIIKSKQKFFSDEKVTLPFSKEDWQYCYGLVELLLLSGEQYQTATLFYVKALAEFHLDQVNPSLETFKLLDIETDFSSYGRRRIIKTYLASNVDGSPKLYAGEVKRNVSSLKGDKTGEIYVSELKTNIRFIINEFGKRNYQAGESINRFYIGFNFRGPIAVPFKN